MHYLLMYNIYTIGIASITIQGILFYTSATSINDHNY